MFSYSVYYSIVNASPWILITRNKLFFRRVSFYTFFFFFFPTNERRRKIIPVAGLLICNVKCVDASIAAAREREIAKRVRGEYLLWKTRWFFIRIRWNAIPGWHEPRSRGGIVTFDRVEFACFPPPGSHQLASINPVSFSREQTTSLLREIPATDQTRRCWNFKCRLIDVFSAREVSPVINIRCRTNLEQLKLVTQPVSWRTFLRN